MKTNLLAPNDSDLLIDVLLQLESDPKISSRDIAIAVKAVCSTALCHDSSLAIN